MNPNERLWKKLQRPRYRDAFISANVGVQIATQLHALRTRSRKSQDKLANEMGMNQATISQMEKPEYRKYNLGSLIRFAQHYKIALDVRFVSISDYVARLRSQTSASVVPSAFDEPLDIPADSGIPEIPVQETSVSQQPLALTELIPKTSPQSTQEKSNLMEIAAAMNP